MTAVIPASQAFLPLGPDYGPYNDMIDEWLLRTGLPFKRFTGIVIFDGFNSYGTNLISAPVDGVIMDRDFYIKALNDYYLENPAKPREHLWRNDILKGSRKVWTDEGVGWERLKNAPPTHRICIRCNKVEALSVPVTPSRSGAPEAILTT
jgi:hypothetical protein